MTDRSVTATRRARRLRRRVTSALGLAATLGVVGVGYATVAAAAAPHQASAAASTAQSDVDQGKRLFEDGCITCHGRNLQGVADRGPSLIGVGQAATYFQVATGRMPATRQEAQISRKPPKYDEEQSNQLAAYVQSMGGGPQVPGGNLRDGDLAEGGELFRLNCASCHNFAGRGGALSAGKYAPPLSAATDKQMYAAMLSGPQSMPMFSDNQLTPSEKKAIINYVQSLKASKDPGGASLGRLGPVPEGLVLWIIGIGGLMLTILWIGAKS